MAIFSASGAFNFKNIDFSQMFSQQTSENVQNDINVAVPASAIVFSVFGLDFDFSVPALTVEDIYSTEWGPSVATTAVGGDNFTYDELGVLSGGNINVFANFSTDGSSGPGLFAIYGIGVGTATEVSVADFMAAATTASTVDDLALVEIMLSGNDVMSLSNKKDVAYGFDGNDYMRGQKGSDKLDGGNGHDYISGGKGSDKMYGQSGNDFLVGGSGNDLYHGGSGNDSAYLGEGGNVTVDLRITVVQDTGEGMDKFRKIENVFTAGGNDTISGNDVANQLRSTYGDNTFYGFGGDDILSGGPGNQYFDGGKGKDTVELGELLGYDITVNLNTATAQTTGEGTGQFISIENITTFGGKDTITGDGNNNVITTGAKSDKLYGKGGADNLFGEDGNDLLDGGGGADYLSGGAGKDILIGGKGNDILRGGSEADKFVFNGKSGFDVIVDYVDGEDKIKIKGGANAFDDLTIAPSGDTDVTISFGNTVITVEGASVSDFDVSDFIF